MMWPPNAAASPTWRPAGSLDDRPPADQHIDGTGNPTPFGIIKCLLWHS